MAEVERKVRTHYGLEGGNEEQEPSGDLKLKAKSKTDGKEKA